MNKIKWLLSVACIVLFQFGNAQCNVYFPLDEGVEWTYENYDTKGKVEGSQTQKVSEFNSTSNGYKATMDVTAFDKKGKEVTSGSLEITCDKGKLLFDMRKFIPEEQMKAFSSYEMEIQATNLEYPSNLKQGTTLEDGQITMTANGSPIPIKMEVNIINRTVVAKEKITTAAGTFDAFKIESTSVIKNQMGINMTFEFEQIEWVAEGTGMIKNESYRKGKLQGYTELISKKP